MKVRSLWQSSYPDVSVKEKPTAAVGPRDVLPNVHRKHLGELRNSVKGQLWIAM
jgi:hypothetical protein